MRGRIDAQSAMVYAFHVQDRIPPDHPLRAIRARVDAELRGLSGRFAAAYSEVGRPSTPPEQILKALLLQALYSIPSERKLCEHLAYNLLFQWFVGLRPDEAVWDPSTFSQNRQRFAEHGILRAFFESTVTRAIAEGAAGCEDFCVDGTLIQSWASAKSVVRKEDSGGDPPSADLNAWSRFRGEKRSNKTHGSVTDPEAKLARKSYGQETKLCHSMHVLTDSVHHVVMAVSVSDAGGKAERREARKMLTRVRARHGVQPKTLAADKGYDEGRFLLSLERGRGIVPLVPTRRGSIGGGNARALARQRARRRQGTQRFQRAQRLRRQVEPVIGWLKQVALLRRTRFVGRWKTQIYAYAAAAAFNIARLCRLGVLPT